MTTQEILASLSQLEKELESIASARLLAENTITAYKEVQSDIKIFFSEFKKVMVCLNRISKAFEAEKSTLTSDVKSTVDILKGQMNTLNKTFAEQCNTIVLSFVNSSNEVSEEFKNKTNTLIADYELNNDTFKARITELSVVQRKISKVVESVAIIKSDIDTLQAQLVNSQKQQEAILRSIVAELELKVDGLLNTLKQNVDGVSNKLNTIQARQETLASDVEYIKTGISGLDSLIDDKSKETKGSFKEILNVNKSANTMIIVNIIFSIIILLMVLFK